MLKPVWMFAGVITLLAVVLVLATAPLSAVNARDSLPFVWIAAGAFTARLFAARPMQRPSYALAPVFNLAAALLLSPLLFALTVTLPYLAHRVRLRWGADEASKDVRAASYLTILYMGGAFLGGLAARGIFALFAGSGSAAQAPVAGCAAALTYVLADYLLTAIGLKAGGQSETLSDTAAASAAGTDLLLALTGYGLAAAWDTNPWLALPALAPLLLLRSALEVPQLRLAARTDEKTGLWNARHFAALAERLLRCANVNRQPLALLMADLDLLRDINNRYGHLAGDAVLAEIGTILQEIAGSEDLAARFGGEEFCIVRLNAGLLDAHALAESLRLAVAERRFKVPGRSEPIQATLSVGVACFPEHGATLLSLMQAADMAVYRAKRQGRNCVVDAQSGNRA